jgi:hypothetical protein
VVDLRNFGGNTLTAVTINYQIDGGALNTHNWTGNLVAGNITSVTLPTITTTEGSHSLTVYTTDPNSATDLNGSNDSQTSSFAVSTSGMATPIVQGFEPGSFPPAGWILDNPDGGYTWERTTSASSTGSASIYINNYDYEANGEVDELIMPMMDMSNAVGATLEFDIAYALYSQTGFSDTLDVWVSTNCGTTWTRVYHKYDNALTTVPGIIEDPFFPNQNQWRTETIDLSSYTGGSSVMVKFRHATDYENNLFIDDINITSVNTGIENNNLLSGVTIYPNPSAGNVYVDLQLNSSQDVTIQATNAVGQVIFEINEKSINRGFYTLDLNKEANGIYFVEVIGNEASKTQKIILNK